MIYLSKLFIMRKLYITSFIAVIFSSLQTTAQSPVAITDFATIFAGEKTTIDVQANDIYNPSHTIQAFAPINTVFDGNFYNIGNGAITIYPSLLSTGIDTINYILRDVTASLNDTGMLIMSIEASRSTAFLDVNNVKALVNSNGRLFNFDAEHYYFEIPKDSGTNTIFEMDLMIGGKNSSGITYLNMDRYNTDELWKAGPLDTTDAINDSVADFYQRVWNVLRAEIEYHRQHWWEAGYTIPEAILNWPAHGDQALNFAKNLAPYIDENNNGIYDPQNGDYPFIKGDQAIFFICNNPVNPISSIQSMGIEIHGMMYAFNCAVNSLFNTSAFLDLKVINRSNTSFHEAFFGAFVDTDIGGSKDDYVGCFVDLQSMYGINGDSIDESCDGAMGYYDYPPAQGITLLKGPKADLNDGIDNNFNNTIDESGETIGLTSFIANMANENIPPSLEDVISDYYAKMRGLITDSQSLKWNYDSTSAECKYEYPGTSDPNWIGTGGIPQTPTNWSEYTMGNMPNERRSVMSSGPFTFNQGDSKDITLAFVYAQKDGDEFFEVSDLLHYQIEKLFEYYAADSVPCGGSFSGIQTPNTPIGFEIFPNPASELVNISIDANYTTGSLQIFSISGQLMSNIPIYNNQTSILVSCLPQGIYLVRLSRSNAVKRLVIVR